MRAECRSPLDAPSHARDDLGLPNRGSGDREAGGGGDTASSQPSAARLVGLRRHGNRASEKRLEREPYSLVRQWAEANDGLITVRSYPCGQAGSLEAMLLLLCAGRSARSLVVSVDPIPASLQRPDGEAIGCPDRARLGRERGVVNEVGGRRSGMNALAR